MWIKEYNENQVIFLSVEEKYAAPPPSYDSATGNASAIPGAGVTPQAKDRLISRTIFQSKFSKQTMI